MPIDDLPQFVVVGLLIATTLFLFFLSYKERHWSAIVAVAGSIVFFCIVILLGDKILSVASPWLTIKTAAKDAEETAAEIREIRNKMLEQAEQVQTTVTSIGSLKANLEQTIQTTEALQAELTQLKADSDAALKKVQKQSRDLDKAGVRLDCLIVDVPLATKLGVLTSTMSSIERRIEVVKDPSQLRQRLEQNERERDALVKKMKCIDSQELLEGVTW